MIEIKDLNMALLVAETGSVSATARRMHVTQPAVSQRLARLQDRLGTAVFERQDNHMRPTPAGQRLLSAAQTIGDELDALLQDIRQLNRERNNRLRVATQCYTCYRWLPFVLRDLRLLYPDLEIDVVPEATDRPFSALENELLEIAMVSSPDSGEGFPSHELFNDELFAVMHDGHPLAGQKFVRAAQFSPENLILYTGKRHAILEEILIPSGVSPKKIIQVRITEAIVELARSGQGIAILSGWAFADLDNPAGLTAVRITRKGFLRSWRAVTSRACNPAHVAGFIKCVQRIGARIQQQSWRKALQDEHNPVHI